MATIEESPFDVILCDGFEGTSRISAQSRIFLNRPIKESDNIPTVESIKKENEQTKVTGGKLGEWLATGKYMCSRNSFYIISLNTIIYLLSVLFFSFTFSSFDRYLW
jgi:hypothetical protein